MCYMAIRGVTMPVKVQVVDTEAMPVRVSIRRPAWQEFLQY